MTRKDKAIAIVERLTEICNENGRDPTPVISFGPDVWGGNTLTLFMEGSHTHVGTPKGEFGELIDQLYNLLIEGEGLSLA